MIQAYYCNGCGSWLWQGTHICPGRTSAVISIPVQVQNQPDPNQKVLDKLDEIIKLLKKKK